MPSLTHTVYLKGNGYVLGYDRVLDEQGNLVYRENYKFDQEKAAFLDAAEALAVKGDLLGSEVREMYIAAPTVKN